MWGTSPLPPHLSSLVWETFLQNRKCTPRMSHTSCFVDLPKEETRWGGQELNRHHQSCLERCRRRSWFFAWRITVGSPCFLWKAVSRGVWRVPWGETSVAGTGCIRHSSVHAFHHVLFTPLPSLALGSLLNGAMPGVRRCGRTMHGGGVGRTVALPHPRRTATWEQLWQWEFCKASKEFWKWMK